MHRRCTFVLSFLIPLIFLHSAYLFPLTCLCLLSTQELCLSEEIQNGWKAIFTINSSMKGTILIMGRAWAITMHLLLRKQHPDLVLETNLLQLRKPFIFLFCIHCCTPVDVIVLLTHLASAITESSNTHTNSSCCTPKSGYGTVIYNFPLPDTHSCVTGESVDQSRLYFRATIGFKLI